MIAVAELRRFGASEGLHGLHLGVPGLVAAVIDLREHPAGARAGSPGALPAWSSTSMTPANLFPFGRLSVWHGVVIVGLVMIPLILLGMPSRAGFLVIGFSIIGLLAVFIPLWGVHEQIGSAKAKALNAMNQQLLEVQTQWLNPSESQRRRVEAIVRQDQHAVDPAQSDR